MKLEISHDNNKICFKNSEIGFYGYTTFNQDLFEKINSVGWSVNDKKFLNKEKTYIKTGSKKLGKYQYLHQIVMIHWYGLDKFEEANRKKFIVEHHDNDGFNCLIENLSFAPDNVNKAKGLTYDQERPNALPIVAINFFKDFDTKKYQITLGFNIDFSIREDGKLKSITALYLVYEDDFRIVINDASNLLYNLIEYKEFDLSKLQLIDYKYTETIYTQKYEDMPPLIEVDGEMALVLDERTRLVSVAPDSELYK
ncbi:hypothetical protein B1B04_05335 [Lysinibacillus sp. KCTC 33748]|uniref:hypothetical protein n=1 Tax=unclassified Lysinibacillus TaxID=2636778 RepID=UPI0009A6C9A9|nr:MULTISPECIES: hypothetical protein [unclassified Lysinibacillus]OXS76397.1 hypothetical protein B1B04_05335 [Lysinibacillus sp. KCTC 33748]SKB45324.1 hypothetical protein SAMN06295926_102551 [Lysinibacillus sp. AC-3]